MESIQDYKKKALMLLREHNNQLSDKRISDMTDKYIKTVKNEVQRYWLDIHANGQFAFVSIDQIKRYGGMRKLSKGSNKNTYISRWFDKNLPLYKICEKGSSISGKLTLIVLNYDLGLAIDTIYSSKIKASDKGADEAVRLLYGNAYNDLIKYADTDDVVDVVKIDMKSLKAYIDYYEYRQAFHKQKKASKSCIASAKRVFSAANMFSGSLLQVVNESEYGRRYYKAVNLQSVSKDIRHAALGNCIEFDIENSVFAWRYDMACDIDTENKFSYTLDYLDNKKYWRRKIANHVFSDISTMSEDVRIKNIKQAFSAIGFGARGTVSNVAWMKDGKLQMQALNKIIKTVEGRKRFFKHEFVSRFINEQKIISKLIFQAAKDIVGALPFYKGKKLEQNDVLAFLYQQQERMIIDECISLIPKNDLLLVVHDAFYVRRMNAETLLNIKCMLKQRNNSLSLSKTVYSAWTPYDREAELHRVFKKEEKRLVENYIKSKGAAY